MLVKGELGVEIVTEVLFQNRRRDYGLFLVEVDGEFLEGHVVEVAELLKVFKVEGVGGNAEVHFPEHVDSAALAD